MLKIQRISTIIKRKHFKAFISMLKNFLPGSTRTHDSVRNLLCREERPIKQLFKVKILEKKVFALAGKC
jgi:hypothetical protein